MYMYVDCSKCENLHTECTYRVCCVGYSHFWASAGGGRDMVVDLLHRTHPDNLHGEREGKRGLHVQ